MRINEIAPLIGAVARAGTIARTAATAATRIAGRNAPTSKGLSVNGKTVGTQGTQGTLQQRLKSQGNGSAVKTAKDVIGKMFSKSDSKEPGGDIKRGQEFEFQDPKKPGSNVTYKVKAVGGRDVTVEPKKPRDGSPQQVVFDKKTLANR